LGSKKYFIFVNSNRNIWGKHITDSGREKETGRKMGSNRKTQVKSNHLQYFMDIKFLQIHIYNISTISNRFIMQCQWTSIPSMGEGGVERLLVASRKPEIIKISTGLMGYNSTRL